MSEASRGMRWTVTGVLLLVLCWRLAAAPTIVAAAALAPALVYGLAIALLLRRSLDGAAASAASVLCGAVVATAAAATLNEVAHAWIGALASGAEARALAPAVAVPVIEEVAKAGAIALVAVLWPQAFRTVADGAGRGALVGLGFAVTENLLYLTVAGLQGGYAGVLRSAYLRGVVYGATHAVFTASTGAAVGYARTRVATAPAASIVVLGLGVAVAQHVLWNTVASSTIQRLLCGATEPGTACLAVPSAVSLYVAVPAVAALALAPGIAMLVVALRWAGASAARQRTLGITSRS